MSWISNGLIWRTAGTVLVFAALPPAAVALLDNNSRVACVAPKEELKTGTILQKDLFVPKQVDRDEAPRDPALEKDLIGRRAAKSLALGECLAASDVKTASLTFAIELAGTTVIGEPAAGKTVDLLLAPLEGQDARDGASIEGAPVSELNDKRVIVELSKEQQATILKHSARSKITIRAR